ncbi:protein of unknown function [Tepidibacter aestuarii]|nr:protein of unknown function [Tepidibacter aestuarii]
MFLILFLLNKNVVINKNSSDNERIKILYFMFLFIKNPPLNI